jgi:GT2 family glycosyltransferase
MTPEQDLAILIPTRNRPAILQRTLEELQKLGFGGHPLVVYDDASSKPSAIREVVLRWPGARLLQGEVRCGQAKGRNQLLRACPSEYGLFLDDDSFPEDRASLLNTLALMGTEQLGVAALNYKSLADGKFSIPIRSGRRRVASFLGGASIFHVSSVLRTGGYQERLIYGYEEPELGFRLWLGGVRMKCFPDVIILHNHFETPGEMRDDREYDFLYARNGILMSSLNCPVWLGLPHGILRSLRRSLYRRRNMIPKLRGTLAGVWMTFSLWAERKPCSWRKALEWARFNRS